MFSTRSSLALVVLVTAAAEGTWDLTEWLGEEEKQDTATSQHAKCWCEELSSLVSTRLSTADGEVQQLEPTKETQHYQNQQLKMQVHEHQEEVQDHSRTLNEAQSIWDRKQTQSQQEIQDLHNSLSSIDKALDALPESSKAQQVHGTLQSLKESFSDHLQDAKESMEAKQKQAEGLQEAKQKMMGLAKAGMATKQQRLADGLAVVAQVERQLEVVSEQQKADVALRGSVGGLCSLLEQQGEERKMKRQATLLLGTQAKADRAEKEALKATGLVFLRRGAHASARRSEAPRPSPAAPANRSSFVAVRAHLASQEGDDCMLALERAEDTKTRLQGTLEGSQKAAAELMTLIEKSDGTQGELQTMLHSHMTEAHLAAGKVPEVHLQASVQQLFSLAQAQLAALEAPFNALRETARTSSSKDARLVLELRSAVADAELKVVETRKCSRARHAV